MAKRNKPAVQRYHDRVARRYDDIYDDAYWLWHDTLTWDHLKAHLPTNPALPVLDLGCGTGKWGLKLAKSGFSVTCVDISGAMIERARRKFGESGFDDRCSFVQADICDLSSLPKGEFSLAVAFGEPICCASSPQKALKQIRKRLTEDGILVATFDNRWAALDYYLERGQLKEMNAFIGSGQTHWLTKDADEQFELHTYAPSQVVKLLERCGFEVIDLVGKTVLPMRRYRSYLEDAVQRRAWLKIEKRLWRDPAAIGRAAHIQVAARVAGRQ